MSVSRTFRVTGETREMRLFSKLLTHRAGTDLACFIAAGRLPGERYRSWEELVFDLAQVTGELVSNVSLRKWARRYGIPEDSRADDNPAPYLKKVRAAGIDLSATEAATPRP